MSKTCKEKFPNNKKALKACRRIKRRTVESDVKKVVSTTGKKVGGFFKKTFNDTKDVITGKKKIKIE
tara:strand:+ start:1212 stop:1412 length:201 start_codon:yes stop_codon:yes gene_type:complete